MSTIIKSLTFIFFYCRRTKPRLYLFSNHAKHQLNLQLKMTAHFEMLSAVYVYATTFYYTLCANVMHLEWNDLLAVESACLQ